MKLAGRVSQIQPNQNLKFPTLLNEYHCVKLLTKELAIVMHKLFVFAVVKMDRILMRCRSINTDTLCLLNQ